MPPRSSNRYAALDNTPDSPIADNLQPIGGPAPDEKDNNTEPWQVVKIRTKRRVTVRIVQRDDTSGTRTPSSTSDPAVNPHENWCGMCYIRFPSKAALQTHVKANTGHQHYCNLCKRVFRDRNGLQNHLENSLGHEIFCNLCLSAFVDKWGLKNHFENNYTVGHEFICLTCLLGFRTEYELESHLQTGEMHVWCHTCDRRFGTQNERDNHWKSTTKHKHCVEPGCDFDGLNAEALEIHLEQDHFRCEGCKQIFPSATKLNAHSDKCQSTIACLNCGQGYAGRGKLAQHRETCFSGQNTSKHLVVDLPCWGCETLFPTASSMLAHLESGKCPKFSDPSRLIHILGKWWYSPLYMDISLHSQLLTGSVDPVITTAWMNDGLLLPFICRAEGCGKTFGHLSALTRHVQDSDCSWDVERLGHDKLGRELEGIVFGPARK